MSIKKKFQAKLAEIGSELEDHFDELKSEIERRFGPRKNDGEVFRGLPAPAGLMMPLGDALAARRSERNFSNEPLPDPLLANLLYAADGINRSNGKRTTPSAFNWRETEIYVLKPNGIWRWVPERNGLIFCSPDDIRGETYLVEMPLAALPPVILVYVTNFERTQDLVMKLASVIVDKAKRSDWTEERLEEARVRSTHIDVGLKMQAVALAAAAMKLASVPRTGFLAEELGKKLHLKPTETVAAVQSVGYPAKSMFDHIF